MKYFSHLCTAQDDDKFDLLFERHSFEGYGVYWWLCEHVGRRKKNANDNPEYLLNTNLRRYERGMRGDKLIKIVHSLADYHLIEITEEPGWISVKIPKLNAYSAEWQKRLSKRNYGETPELLPSGLPSGLGREVVDVKILEEKRRSRSKATPPASAVEAAEPSSAIEDPKARAEALKVIKDAMKTMNIGEPLQQVPKSQDSGNGKIPRAEGQEVEDMGVKLELEGFVDPAAQDILDAWWARKQGTHNEYALAAMLDKHNIKGQDRSKVYRCLGVV